MPPLLPSSLLRSSLRPLTRTFATTPSLPVAKITIVGRLAADPELVSTATGDDIVRYALGTSYGPKENRQTSWWRVACFEKEGRGRDRVMELSKGTLVYLEGDARMRKFETKDGRAETALSIVQQRLEILKRPDNPSGHEEEPSE